MKKIIVMIMLILVGNAFADPNQPNAEIEALQLQIKDLKSQITQLQTAIEMQKAENKRLRTLCLDAGIDIKPKKQIKQSAQSKSNRAIFGVYLGEPLRSLENRHKIRYVKNVDEFLSMYHVSCEHESIGILSTGIYDNKVVVIYIIFNDSSESNLNAIKDLCEKKYGSKLEKQFAIDPTYLCNTKIGEQDIQIRLELEKGFQKNTLSIMYTDLALQEKYEKALEAKKASKISNQL